MEQRYEDQNNIAPIGDFPLRHVAAVWQDDPVDAEASPRNTASDRAYEGFHLLGDRQYLTSLHADPGGWYSPNLVREDRRRIVGAPTTRTLEEFVEQARTWLDLSDSAPMFSIEDVVAVRGERCALLRCRVAYRDTATEFLNAFRNGMNGETQTSVLFDLDDREAAIAELNRLHADGESVGDADS